MKIGVIGAGNVGGTLGTRWAQAGHDVTFGVRDPQSAEVKKVLAQAGSRAKAASVRDAAQANDVVVLATPWPATGDAIQAAGDLAGKTVIDATNPVRPQLDGLEFGTNTSAAEQVAQWAPGAKVVKAFNTVGFGIMANPVFDGSGALMLYCGDDATAKATARQLASDLGFDPMDAGPLTQARVLEPFAMLWISLKLQGKPDFAFQILQR